MNRPNFDKQSKNSKLFITNFYLLIYFKMDDFSESNVNQSLKEKIVAFIKYHSEVN